LMCMPQESLFYIIARLLGRARGIAKSKLVTQPVPARVPGAFFVDLLEDTGRMDRGEAELLLSWVEWVEVEARGVPALLEGLCRL